MQHFIVLFFIKGLIIGSIYALISLGLNVIYRTTGVINFAQGEFVMVGGIVSAWANTTLGWALPLAVLLGMLAALLVGVLLELLAVRPVRSADPVMAIILPSAPPSSSALPSRLSGARSFTICPRCATAR